MLNAKSVPDILWEYMGLIEFMNENLGMYHMDYKRKECHDRVAKYFKVTREDVSEALKDSKDAVDLWYKLKNINK